MFVHVSAVQVAGLSTTIMTEGQQLSFERVIERGKPAAKNLRFGWLVSDQEQARLELARIEANPSYRDGKGAVPFTRVGDLLRIAPQMQTERSRRYRDEVQWAIDRILDRSVMNRIHNRDPELARLFNEYHSKFDKEDIENVAMSLFIMAQEIDGRIRAGHEEALEDEALDSNTQSYLSTFLLAHNLYMQSFQVIEQVTDDMDRASRLYEALSETFRGTPWKALADLSMRDLIFTPEARGALGLAVRAVDVPAVSQTKG